MGLLIVPTVLALGVYWLNSSQKKTEQEIEIMRQQQATLEAYYDRMTDLLLHHNLRIPNENDEKRSIARARTLAVLRSLDAERKGQILRFLHESRLLWGEVPGEEVHNLNSYVYGEKNNEAMPIVNLQGADLSTAKLKEISLGLSDPRGVDMRTGPNEHGTDLRFTVLRGVDLSKADLEGANLSMASFSGSNFSEANLVQTDMRGTNLRDTDLKNVRIREALLHGANLKGADLGETDLRKAKSWERANLSEAILTAADLRGANLKKVDLLGANLSQANLFGADLSNADLRGADLSNADLREANLIDVKLLGTKLRGADLRRAKLRESSLKFTDLHGETYGKTEYDNKTKWPKKYYPENAIVESSFGEDE